MSKLLDKLERKFSKYAIRNLSLYLIICYCIGYLLSLLNNFFPILDFVSLNPDKIMHGQVWRIVTWVLIPPSRFDLFTIIMLYFYYSIGNSLERTWGEFRYNVYIFSGMLFSLIGAMGLYFIYVFMFGQDPYNVGLIISASFSTYYINLSIFLAFAAVYPDMQVLLFFIIPVKMKWMAILDVVYLGYLFITNSMGVRIAIVMSLLNFLLFFFGTRDYKKISYKEIKRKRDYKNATTQYSNAANQYVRHRCHVCGITNNDDPEMEFRYCSKCMGNYEYCREHLFTHTHIK